MRWVENFGVSLSRVGLEASGEGCFKRSSSQICGVYGVNCFDAQDVSSRILSCVAMAVLVLHSLRQLREAWRILEQLRTPRINKTKKTRLLHLVLIAHRSLQRSTRRATVSLLDEPEISMFLVSIDGYRESMGLQSALFSVKTVHTINIPI